MTVDRVRRTLHERLEKRAARRETRRTARAQADVARRFLRPTRRP
ncbi:MAG TPA: hypothetical protein VHF45_04130 [Thermoleophilaceae bacterium]|nr:hypothetical protein [Thermoleophilaceae bacterium]